MRASIGTTRGSRSTTSASTTARRVEPVAARSTVWMARAADGSSTLPSAATAACVTRGSLFRSSGCSSGTTSADPMVPRRIAPARWANHRESPIRGARREIAGFPNPTMVSEARVEATPSSSTATMGRSASILDGPTVVTMDRMAFQAFSSTSPMIDAVSRIASDSPSWSRACRQASRPMADFAVARAARAWVTCWVSS